MTTVKYDYPKPGCYIDESAGSADDCNRRTIEFAEEYGFEPKFSGCFDGLRGLYIEMSLDDAESCAHPGECSDDVEVLAMLPRISIQLDAMGPDKIRAALKECGGWAADELSDDWANRNRAVWIAASDLKENYEPEQLSEVAEEAVAYLNGLEDRSFMSWGFEDNSLFLMVDVDGASESGIFRSVQSLADARRMGVETDPEDSCYPPKDYQGEWLHVNDHGNATLYVRENGKDREIWSVV